MNNTHHDWKMKKSNFPPQNEEVGLAGAICFFVPLFVLAWLVQFL